MKSIGIYVATDHSPLLEGLLSYFTMTDAWSLRLECFGELGGSAFDRSLDLAGVLIDAGQRPRLAQQARDVGVPVVSFATNIESPEFVTVSPDDHEAGRIVGRHMADRGFRHFAFCGLPPHRFSVRRARGFYEACRNVAESFEEYTPRTNDIWTHYSNSANRPHLAEWLAALPRPVGIMVVTDIIARFVLLACESIGLKIPEQAIVASVDNNPVICNTVHPTLTSLDLNNKRRGFVAAQWLDRLIAGETPESNQILIEPTLVPRRSTDALATKDQDVVAALRFIWEHSDRPLSVGNVVAAIPVSRRSLEIRFKREVGRTMQAEISRAHVERATRLLIDTDLPTPMIAERAGYGDASQLSRAVRQFTGLTPTAYRRRYRHFEPPAYAAQ
jgi:LacI family transcriptional regulator